jgi:5-bromo-4-chloroindolyl phosphate hydrolysis protein
MLVGGNFLSFAAIGAAMALLFYAGRQVDDGLLAEQEGTQARFAESLLPPKLTGAVATGAAAFLLSAGATSDDPLMSVVFAALAFFGCALAYGTEAHSLDRGKLLAEAAKRAGVRPRDVADALAEARRKVGEIEAAAARLHSRDLKAHLDRIVRQARQVLSLVEQNPRDLSRARRFLVTYLDGTRDVVAKYAAQQRDVAETALADNFRRVLTTVEQVFAEQEKVLRSDDKLDLEVKIEVLETQMRREGVH